MAGVSVDSPGFPRTCLIPTCHVTQSYTWDCGLACVKMVMSETVRHQFSEMLNDIQEQMGFGKRVWTIDLVHILQFYGINQKYCTITIGVDPTYERKMFYMHADFMAEHQRVENQFQRAREVGINVEKRSVEMLEILQHLSTNGPAIVLTNNSLLRCSCWTHLSNCCNSACPNVDKYTGHYVVLCGYDLDERVVLYRNPGYRDCVCKCSFEDFDSARKSHGTDEDIVFVICERPRSP